MIKVADNPALRAQIEGAAAAPIEPVDNPSARAAADRSPGLPAAYPAKSLAVQNGRYVVVDQPK